MPEKVTEPQRQVGRRLKAARVAAGLGQDDVAAVARTHRMTVSRWERGASPVPEHVRGMIADLLGTAVESIWGGTMHGVSRGTPHRVAETLAPYSVSGAFPSDGTAADGALWAAEKFTEALARVSREARIAKLPAVPVHEAHEEPTKATVRPGRVAAKKSGGGS